MTDLLVVGLGNPGTRYETTRHNVGFCVVDELRSRWKESWIPGKGEYAYASTRIGGAQVTIAKPATWMNLSGHAVKELLEFTSVPTEQLLVVLDDVALPLGKLRIRTEGSDGGHNGIASVIWAVQTEKFMRLRCGIGGETPVPAEKLAEYVLAPFGGDEVETVGAMVRRAADAVETIALNGPEQAMNRFNS